MGFTPQQVQGMTFWEFSCAFAAWKRFNGVKTPPPTVSAKRLHELGIE